MLEKHISRHLPNNATKSSNKYNNNNNKRQSLSSSAEHAPTSRKNNEKKSKCCDKCSYKCTTDGNLQQHKMFKVQYTTKQTRAAIRAHGIWSKGRDNLISVWGEGGVKQ